MKMVSRNILLIILVIRGVCCLQIPEFDTDGRSQKSSLCELGCKCPEDSSQRPTLVDCDGKSLTQLPSGLRFDPAVKMLGLQNNALQTLRSSTFLRGDGIEQIDLSSNRIDKIENFTFVPFRSLTHLKLSHNRLSELSEGLLEGLQELRVLEVGYNALLAFPPLAFRNTPALQELRMQYNPIFSLPDDAFRYLPNLRKLDLEDVGLVSLPESVFSSTPRLQWLSLSNNAFEAVPREALAHAPIQSLDLSGNDFTSLVKGDFGGLSSLTTLHLNRLPILRTVGRDALSGLPSLSALSLSFNPRLVAMHPAAFGDGNATRRTPPKEQLYLRQNAIRTMQEPVDGASWSSLSFVDLADNPWHCDCNLHWMLRQLKPETRMNIVCESPARLRGQPLGALSTTQLTCEDKWAFVVYVTAAAFAVAIGMVAIATAAIVCSRSKAGLYLRVKKQFSYSKVKHPEKIESVDLEWDPSADL